MIGDDDLDVNMVSNSAIDSKIRLIVNSGKIHGYGMDSSGLNIVPMASSCDYYQQGPYGWADWGDYMFGYGFGSFDFSYGSPFNVWFNQSFNYYINYVPKAQQFPSDNDLTPTGNCRQWTRLVYEVGNKFIAGMSNYHFRTRSITETIAAPKDLLADIQIELDSLVNHGRSSGRPAPLPLLAIGVRTLYSGLWWSSTGLGLGYEFLGFQLSY